jgi:glutamate-5-semialdehyde dehydrogenase
MTETFTGTVLDAARRARLAAASLARTTTEERNRALALAARRLAERAPDVLAANARDLAGADALVASGELSRSALKRLAIDEAKLREIVSGVEQVASLEDPIGKTTLATELDDGLVLTRVTCPIGVVGVIFESRPDALTQIASLCVKSANAVILKGGREAEHSNRILFEVFREAVEAAGLPAGALALLETREEVSELLGAAGLVDLIIPRGSADLVRYVQASTTIPVLAHADGVCHVYVDAAADLDMALDIVVDAKTQYPAVCNAAETLLVHRDVATRFLPLAISALGAKGVTLRVDPEAIVAFGLERVEPATEADWRTEYGDLTLAVRVVDSLGDAIAHVNEYGSRHTDAIVTGDDAAWERFFAEVDSASVFRNASTRFADGFRYGFGAEVGISTAKLHPRGPVGLDGLATYKYRLVGTGHTVAPYTGPNARPFTHRSLEE